MTRNAFREAMRLADAGYDVTVTTTTTFHISKKEPQPTVSADDPEFDRALDAWRDED